MIYILHSEKLYIHFKMQNAKYYIKMFKKQLRKSTCEKVFRLNLTSTIQIWLQK